MKHKRQSSSSGANETLLTSDDLSVSGKRPSSISHSNDEIASNHGNRNENTNQVQSFMLKVSYILIFRYLKCSRFISSLVKNYDTISDENEGTSR